MEMNGRGKGSGDGSAADDLVRRYHASSAELNEQPAASARAAILAAAARETQARPIIADAPYQKPGTMRWPLAAAAAVMLSTLAVMLAVRTNDEMPQFESPQTPASRAAENSAPMPVLPPVASIDPAQPLEQAASPPTESRRSAARNVAPKVQRERGVDAVADSQSELQQSVPSATTMNQPANAPAATPALPTPAPNAKEAKLRAEEAVSGAAARPRSTAPADADARRDSAPTMPPAASLAKPSERSQAEEPAALWLERIIKLRRDGRHDEADAELRRFRERYPQVQLPADALPATGTR